MKIYIYKKTKNRKMFQNKKKKKKEKRRKKDEYNYDIKFIIKKY